MSVVFPGCHLESNCEERYFSSDRETRLCKDEGKLQALSRGNQDSSGVAEKAGLDPSHKQHDALEAVTTPSPPQLKA